MTQSNPIHHIVPDHLHYSQIDNAEVRPGVTSAASWSFWDEPIERAFRRRLVKTLHAEHGAAEGWWRSMERAVA